MPRKDSKINSVVDSATELLVTFESKKSNLSLEQKQYIKDCLKNVNIANIVKAKQSKNNDNEALRDIISKKVKDVVSCLKDKSFACKEFSILSKYFHNTDSFNYWYKYGTKAPSKQNIRLFIVDCISKDINTALKNTKLKPKDVGWNIKDAKFIVIGYNITSDFNNNEDQKFLGKRVLFF